MSILKKIVFVLSIIIFLFTFSVLSAYGEAEDLEKRLRQIEKTVSNLTRVTKMSFSAEIPAEFTFQKNLYLGMRDSDVRELQKVLNKDPQTRVAQSGHGSSGNETDYFGPATKDAVKRFQEKYESEVLDPVGMDSPNGFVGSYTRMKLNSILKGSEVRISSKMLEMIEEVNVTIKEIKKRIESKDMKTDKEKDDPFGKIIDRGYVITDDESYNYAPSIMLDDGLYRMWWCAKDEGDGDSIFYAESSDGMNWSDPKIVLQAIYGGEQGHWACDPSVVKASNNYYYLFFTSEHPRFWEDEGYSHGDNQIFLATSKDGINWNHANNRNPVISLPKEHQQMHYGIGQSSVIFMENRFIHFYSYAISPEDGFPWGTYVSESTDGGITFTPLNDGESVSSEKEGSDDIFSSVDVKYLPERDKFILVADTGQGSIMFRLLDRDFNIIGRMRPPEGWPEPGNKDLVNHNPGILGDERGHVVNEEMIPVFFGSGKEGFENASTWDMRRADLYFEWEEEAEEPPKPTPPEEIIQGSISCAETTENEITLAYQTEGNSRKWIFKFSERITGIFTGHQEGSYTVRGLSPGTEYEFYLRDGSFPASEKLDSVKCKTREKPPEPAPLPVEDFCSSVSDYNSVGAINGDTVYCDNEGNLWSPTARNLHNFGDAINHCRDLGRAPGGAYAGQSQWMLPTWYQLRNIFGTSVCSWSSQDGMGSCEDCSSCFLNWDNNMGSYYWTSSIYDNEFSWYVGFNPSSVGATERDDRLNVRCFIPSQLIK